MEKTAIENPTDEQIQAEIDSIRIRQKALLREYEQLREQRNEDDKIRNAKISRLNEIGKRILEVSKTNAASTGEVDQLFAEQDKLFEEVESLSREAFRTSRTIDSNFDFRDSLDRRERDLIVELRKKNGR